MTVTIEHTVWCDTQGCKRFLQVAAKTMSEARTYAKTEGWTSNRSTRVDYCPQCSRTGWTGCCPT